MSDHHRMVSDLEVGQSIWLDRNAFVRSTRDRQRIGVYKRVEGALGREGKFVIELKRTWDGLTVGRGRDILPESIPWAEAADAFFIPIDAPEGWRQIDPDFTPDWDGMGR